MNNSISYTEAFDELQEIVSEIEQGEITVDVLSEKVKRAAMLIQICKKQLQTTEENVQTILRALEEES